MREGKFSPDKKMGKESIDDIKRNLAMAYRDVADHYEGVAALNKEGLKRAEDEIKIRKQQLKDLGE